MGLFLETAYVIAVCLFHVFLCLLMWVMCVHVVYVL